MKFIYSLVFVLHFTCTAIAGDRPNVILIVTDDQGYGDMSCHGNPWLETPNLDRLAAEGVRLDDYHVDPVCTPTRAALMTGRYSSRVGAWTVTEGRQLLNPDEVTIADMFADSGYRTGMFGKWHLGDTWPYAPRYRGFQTVVRHLAGGIDEIGNPIGNDYFDDMYYRNGKPEKIDGYCTDVFFAECQRMIAQPSDRPFFVYLPLNAMHSPHTVAAKYSAPFKADGHADARSDFFGQIINFDENLGRLLDFLRSQQIEDNTIVIFMGDNGTAEGGNGGLPDNGYSAGVRGKKGSVYEGGHRVACFVRWPARLNAGQRTDALTSCRDWLPTLVDWCQLEGHDNADFDGRSMASLLDGCGEEWPDRTLFVERQGDQPKLVPSTKRRGKYPHYAVLTERWRMVNGELYDIITDPGQRTNVAAKHEDVLADLRSRYENYFADVFATGAAYTRFQLGVAEENPTRLTVRDWHPTDGNVIWKQEQLGDNGLVINGFWAVHAVRAGRYRISLSRFPSDAPAAMGASEARLEIGEIDETQTIDPSDSSATFDIELPAGDAVMQSWLTDAQTNLRRGAYFADIQFIDQKK
ncbi:arylsulfatase [Rubripirellula reticaptiva]|uniref:Arylsulfatase n=1 Tax=Rubripirellula reticaptiva TaxID=2528013 RepID=A0A5C6F5C1_9BACT|nr:arylsulfatase [Rubripirellula reticaptiva]TWU55597.1 Arylsulfatase [Rubripirellula reticaptiva]